jgi:hypothetical protein
MASRGSYAFLWETHAEFQPSYASALAEAAQVFPGILSFLHRPISLSGHVTDSYTGRPVAASITYVGVKFENGEINGSNERTGRYDVFLPDGIYTLEFSAKGYFTQSHVVDVISTTSESLDVALIPKADLDSDGDVDVIDFALFSLNWDRINCGACGGADLTGDEIVAMEDFQVFTEHWLAGR